MFQYQSRRPKQQNDLHVELIDLNTPAPVRFLFSMFPPFPEKTACGPTPSDRDRHNHDFGKNVNGHRWILGRKSFSLATLLNLIESQRLVRTLLLVSNPRIHHETTVNTTDRLDVA
jgi:hypothetical protein